MTSKIAEFGSPIAELGEWRKFSPMCFYRGILLFVLCTGVAFAGSRSARAQDAASPMLLEPSVTVTATPTARPKKRTSEPSAEISTKALNEKPAPVAEETISTKAPSEKPAPVAEETPPAEALVTPATTQKKAHVKRHATPAAQPVAAELPFPGVMSMSAAKAVAVSTPMPQYPYQARRARITGSGICVMTVDAATGNVTTAVMEQSTGDGILDKVTTDTFRKWRFKPGTVSQVRIPVSFE
jgi:TonB family protein